MAQACSICTNAQRHEINAALATTEPVLRIAKRFGVAESSLRRHRDKHLNPQLVEAIARRAQIDADRLTSWLVGINEHVVSAIFKTQAQEDWPNFRALNREFRENLALLGRLGGVLDAPTLVVDNRKQMAVLGSLSDDDLRALAEASRAGRLQAAAEQVGLPEAAALVTADSKVEDGEWKPATL